MPITFQQVIDLFIDGATEGYSGTKNNKGNLQIKGNQLIHYNTPIAERLGDKFILNISRYSLQTGQLQKKIKESIPEDKRIDIKRVPSETQQSLKDFIEE
jgi:hypothetical protein